MSDASGTSVEQPPLLGEWACLAALYDEPAHGWSVAARLRPDGDLGRIWHVSRPLTYRSIDRLAARGWVEVVGREPGAGGPVRTLLIANRRGRAALRRWVRTPTRHLRDLRSELLLKLVIAEQYGIENTTMLHVQRQVVESIVAAFDVAASEGGGLDDVVTAWRREAAHAALRFLEGVEPVSR